MARRDPFMFTPVIDAYPQVRAVATAARRGAWDEVVATIAALPTPSDRGWMMSAVAAHAPSLLVPLREIDTPAGRVLAADTPHERTLAVLSAHCLVRQAWVVRTDAAIDQVTDAQLMQFHEMLARADSMLLEVISLDPGMVDAWSLRLTTSRGLELGVSETRRRHARLTALDPMNVPGHLAMLTELMPSWQGDWPTALEHARSVAASAAPGSLGALAVLTVHLELWAEVGEEYPTRSQVVDEVLAAAQHSVMHPDFVRVLGWREAHSDLALFFSLADMLGHAAVHFRAVEDAPVKATWTYFKEPEVQWVSHRTRALTAKGA